jgi:hypothetical protein
MPRLFSGGIRRVEQSVPHGLDRYGTTKEDAEKCRVSTDLELLRLSFVSAEANEAVFIEFYVSILPCFRGPGTRLA